MIRIPALRPVCRLVFGAVLCVLAASSAAAQQIAERVEFPSADGKTMLVGYLFKPAAPATGPFPAVVMMHGRAGAYSSLAHGNYSAETLSKRHKFWGEHWAAQGYLAILVDGFGPRGYPHGFPRHSYDSRPDVLNEVTVRPLDAYGALAYLRKRGDVIGDRIALQGWSNGGSATLAAMAPDAPGIKTPTPEAGFRVAIAFYPACGLHDHFQETGYAAYAPLDVFMGDDDEEVSPRRCGRLLRGARNVSFRLYDGASHDFDDPGRRRQRVEANAEARDDAVRRATAFLAARIGRK